MRRTVRQLQDSLETPETIRAKLDAHDADRLRASAFEKTAARWVEQRADLIYELGLLEGRFQERP